jgi:glycogen(starch) synthase
LKNQNSSVTVVAFIVTQAPTHNYTVETLKGQAVTKQLRDTIIEIQNAVGKRLFEAASKGHVPELNEIMEKSDIVDLKRRILALKRDALPPIVTHNMTNDSTDPILHHIRKVQLFNNTSDRVKIVFHPEFINSVNPILPMDYEEFVRGCHLGVFPSYYEPWGYTASECTVMGVPSITTNLSGFGCFMNETISHTSDYGVYIVDRRMKSVEESCEQLTGYMYDFCGKTRRQRINQRNRTERLSDLLDWKRMGLEYVKARWVAIRRRWPELIQKMEQQQQQQQQQQEHEEENNEESYENERMTVGSSSSSSSSFGGGVFSDSEIEIVSTSDGVIKKAGHEAPRRAPSSIGSPRLRNRSTSSWPNQSDDDDADERTAYNPSHEGEGFLYYDEGRVLEYVDGVLDAQIKSGKVDVLNVMAQLRAMAIKGTSKEFVPPPIFC